MGLSADTAIVTEAEVEQITFCYGLANLQGSGGTAAITALRNKATNALRRWVRSKGRDPDAVTNVDDFKEAAATWVVAQAYGAQLDEQYTEAAVRFRDRYAEILENELVPETSTGTATVMPYRRPVVVNTTEASWCDPRTAPPLDGPTLWVS